MNSRDLAVVSMAALLGSLVSALTFRFFSSNPRKHHSVRTASAQNGVVSRRFTAQDPFDPSKRKGLGLSGFLQIPVKRMEMLPESSEIAGKDERSKDPNRQVGACLVSQSGVILGKIALGLAIMGFQEDVQMTNFLGQRNPKPETLWRQNIRKYSSLEGQTVYDLPYVCHAEVNAILNTNHASAAGQRLYVTMFPCNECAKIIIQSGVAEVIYFVEKRLNESNVAYIASHKLLSMAGIKVRKHQPQMDQILIKFEEH